MSSLRLMSHNVWGMYAPEVVKRVDNRSGLMWEVYLAYRPDVIGLQECSEDIRKSGLTERMKQLWSEVDVSEDLSRVGAENLYTPLFYNRETCTVCKKGFLLFDRAYNNHDSKGVTWATLRHAPTGAHFTVANTHFWWKSGEEHDMARVRNAEAILSLMEGMPKPTFIMGDLNCTTAAPAYRRLTESDFCDAQLTAPRTDLGNTVHPYPLHDGATNRFYGAPAPSGNYRSAIDHILIDAAHRNCLRRFAVIGEQRALDTSDHCPIMLDCETGETE